MEVTMKIKNLVKTLALTATVATSFSSHADFLDFQVDETPYGGEIVTADKHNGGYKEIITFDNQGNFVANAFANMNQLFANDGGDNLGKASKIGENYALYATFSAEGNLSGPIVFGQEIKNSATKGSFSLFLDPNRDTTAADGDLSLSGESDDIFLGDSSNLGRNTLVFISDNLGGVFDFMFYNFELSAQGQEYFVSPQPFYSYVNVDGDFDTFAFEGTQRVTGDVSAVFVPEPSTLAILGLGLLGLGASSRRKAK
mgnify:CR=1 FL=1